MNFYIKRLTYPEAIKVQAAMDDIGGTANLSTQSLYVEGDANQLCELIKFMEKNEIDLYLSTKRGNPLDESVLKELGINK